MTSVGEQREMERESLRTCALLRYTVNKLCIFDRYSIFTAGANN